MENFAKIIEERYILDYQVFNETFIENIGRVLPLNYDNKNLLPKNLWLKVLKRERHKECFIEKQIMEHLDETEFKKC